MNGDLSSGYTECTLCSLYIPCSSKLAHVAAIMVAFREIALRLIHPLLFDEVLATDVEL